MYTGIQHLHSFTAYLVLAVLFVAILYSIYGWLTNKSFLNTGKRIALSALIVTHLQLLIGLVVYFISPMGISNLSGEAMGNALSRLYALEHPLMMLIAIAVITWGYSKGKGADNDAKKFRTISIYYVIGYILILSRIPWNAWI